MRISVKQLRGVISEEVGRLAEGVGDDDVDCPDCQGSGDCLECDEDGLDTNTGEKCDNCGGTHECPSCMGSGEADDDAYDSRDADDVVQPLSFESWCEEVGRLETEAGFDWYMPTPEFKAEYAEYRNDWMSGLTPQEEHEKLLSELPDDDD